MCIEFSWNFRCQILIETFGVAIGLKLSIAIFGVEIWLKLLIETFDNRDLIESFDSNSLSTFDNPWAVESSSVLLN